jgi:hypothetical protein
MCRATLGSTTHNNGTNVGDASLGHASVAESNIAQANIAQANVAESNIAQANVAQANIAQANIAQANIAQANIAESESDESEISDIEPNYDDSLHELIDEEYNSLPLLEERMYDAMMASMVANVGNGWGNGGVRDVRDRVRDVRERAGSGFDDNLIDILTEFNTCLNDLNIRRGANADTVWRDNLRSIIHDSLGILQHHPSDNL